MTPHQIQIVRHGFADISPIGDQAAALFYHRLFDLRPSLRPVLGGGTARKRRRLMATLRLVAARLDDPGALHPVLGDLGRAHARLGVQPRHYAAIGSALLWTVEVLEGRLTPETRQAWTEVYGRAAAVMIAAEDEAPGERRAGTVSPTPQGRAGAPREVAAPSPA